MASLPLDAAFGLETVPTSAFHPPRTLSVVLTACDHDSNDLRVHRLQAAATAATAPAAAAAWTAAQEVEAVVGPAIPSTAALGAWVAVPCGHAAAFLPSAMDVGADDRYYHLWNAAVDALLLPSRGRAEKEGEGGRRAVVAVAAVAGRPGGWAWRPLAGGVGAGRLVWVEEDGVEWTLAYHKEEEGLGWCLVRDAEAGSALGDIDLVCRRREWMGHDPSNDEHDGSSPPFKLVNAASLRALCTCSITGPCVCRRHLSDDRKWAYHPPTQALVEVNSDRGLYVARANGGRLIIEHAPSSDAPSAAQRRWVYDADAALLLFPAALAVLAADPEGRWEAPLSLLQGRSLDTEEEAREAAVAAASVQRLRWHPERHALPLPSWIPAPTPTTNTTEPPPPPRRAAALSRDAVAGLGLLRSRPAGGTQLLAEGGEARLYVCGEEGLVVKAYHRHAMGKALKELRALLIAEAHVPSSGASALVGLRGVEWPVDGARPTALLLERAAADLRTMLLNAQEQQRRRPLPIRQVLVLAIGLAAAVGRLHAAGLCHKDIHSGNILIRCISGLDGVGLEDIALADLGLVSAWTPLRAALDMRAIALVLLEASWDGARRRHDGDDEDSTGPEPWPPSRITAKSLLHHADPRFLALADLPPSDAAVLGPMLRGCFGEGGRQLTPLGLAAEARRLLHTETEC